MPLKFSDEAFLTMVFLINHLPSWVINHETPLKQLFDHVPDYSSLRTFGCDCRSMKPQCRNVAMPWACVRPPQHMMQSPRSLELEE
jgi:hypothetical protein